jgi:hypothetical protein
MADEGNIGLLLHFVLHLLPQLVPKPYTSAHIMIITSIAVSSWVVWPYLCCTAFKFQENLLGGARSAVQLK